MLVVADRGSFSYDLWAAAADTGAALLWRINDLVDVPVREWLPDGSFRSQVLPQQLKVDLTRGKNRTIPDGAAIPVRVIEYMVTNRDEQTQTIRLITSIADHTLAAAIELAAVYQDRWEFELTLDEVETHQMHHTRVLRSKTPDLVGQEIRALLLTHYAVRHLIHQAADDLGEDPDRLSFLRTQRVVRHQVTNQAGLSPSPTHPRATRHD
jgi:hypothetical protein